MTGTTYVEGWATEDAARSALFDITLEDDVYTLDHEFTYESLLGGDATGFAGSSHRQEVEYQFGTLANRPLVVRIDAPLGASLRDQPEVTKSLATLAGKVQLKVGAPVDLCKGPRECVETCTQLTEVCCKWRCKK